MSETTMQPDEKMEGRFQLVAPKSFLERLDQWRATLPGVPNRSKAIREAMEEIFRKKR